jgi:Fucose 4-O-acetylase and related acetyltransferases
MKGILIYLVIVGHVIAKYAEPGWAYTVIHTFHMPLFFFISGFLAIPSFRQTFKDFAGKKYRRILRPALCWSLLFLLLKLPSHLDLGTKVIKSFMDIWFLYVLFYLFIVVFLMYKSRYRYWLFAGIVILGYLVYPYLLKVPSRHFGYIVEEFRIIREMPVFLMGVLYGLFKDRIQVKTQIATLALSAVLYAGCFLYVLMMQHRPVGDLLAHDNYLVRALVYQTGTILSFGLFKLIYKPLTGTWIARTVESLGQNTLGIYAMNGLLIFTVPGVLGIDYRFGLPLGIYALVLTAVLYGITLILKRNPITRIYLLGEK